jgi:hypothetical protein
MEKLLTCPGCGETIGLHDDMTLMVPVVEDEKGKKQDAAAIPTVPVHRGCETRWREKMGLPPKSSARG